MGRPYSLDLRERVVNAAAAISRRQTAARFEVALTTLIRWMVALAVAARPQEQARRSKLDPHEAFLCALIAEKVDTTLEEMRAHLLAEHDLMVGPHLRHGPRRGSVSFRAPWRQRTPNFGH